MEALVTIGSIGLDLIHLVLLLAAIALAVTLFVIRGQLSASAANARRDLEYAQDSVATLKAEREELRQQVKTKDAVAEQARIDLAKAEARSEEDVKRFNDLAQSAVSQAHKQFLERADERLGKFVEPIDKSFSKFEAKVEELGKDRAVLGQQLKNTETWLKGNQEATNRLVTALSAPKGGGQWGEESLKRALEYAGLSEHVDFGTQVKLNDVRPDAVIYLPNGRQIIVDSKISASEFLLATHETDAEKRTAHLKQHAKHVRDNMKRLVDKAYQDRAKETADFVVMYIGGENMFSAALAHDPRLFEDAFKSGVVLASPSTLVALAKTVALGWREEQIAQNAREVAELGRELYHSLSIFGDRIQKLGTHLDRSVGSYNDFIAALEGNVMPKGRKFVELGASKNNELLSELSPIEKTSRLLRVGKDMQIDVIDADSKIEDGEEEE